MARIKQTTASNVGFYGDVSLSSPLCEQSAYEEDIEMEDDWTMREQPNHLNSDDTEKRITSPDSAAWNARESFSRLLSTQTISPPPPYQSKRRKLSTSRGSVEHTLGSHQQRPIALNVAHRSQHPEASLDINERPPFGGATQQSRQSQDPRAFTNTPMTNIAPANTQFLKSLRTSRPQQIPPANSESLESLESHLGHDVQSSLPTTQDSLGGCLSNRATANVQFIGNFRSLDSTSLRASNQANPSPLCQDLNRGRAPQMVSENVRSLANNGKTTVAHQAPRQNVAPADVNFQASIPQVPPAQARSANVAFLANDLKTSSRIKLPPTRVLTLNIERPLLKATPRFDDLDDPNGPDQPNPTIPYLDTTFQYSPLPKYRPSSIRLLKFRPLPPLVPDNIALYCTITTIIPWETRNNYHCLSYCWGDSTNIRFIYVKDESEPDTAYRKLPVTRNLHEALISILARRDVQLLWIDAISINQKDVQERSAQVAMMKLIYNRASEVVIWLGRHMAADAAYSVISQISKRFTDDTKIRPESILGPEGLRLSPFHLELLKRYTTENVGNMTPADYPSLRVKERTPKEAYELLADLFSLPWFRRVWVLQEAFAQTTISAQFGPYSLPWGSIILAALWQSFLIRDYTSKYRTVQNGNSQGAGYLPELWLGLLHNRTPRGLSMTELVLRARDFLATDPRDKVFALIGLADDAPSIHPDYKASKTSVYCSFAKTIIDQTGNLDILSAVNTFTPELRDRKAPSWMPDLDISIATIRGLAFPRKYNSAFSTTASIINSTDSENLGLRGFILDNLGTTISPLLTLSKDLHLYIGTSPTTIRTLWHTYISPSSLSTLPQKQTRDPSSLLQSFIHTLTATGFALPTTFPVHPLGNVVPPHSVPSLLIDFLAYYARADPALSMFSDISIVNADAEDMVQRGDADQFAVLAGKACHERKFFVSESGRTGLCPREAREGDNIVVLYGGSVPVVLRKLDGENGDGDGEGRWMFVGECYVDGMMFGEAEGWKMDNGVVDEVFEIR